MERQSNTQKNTSTWPKSNTTAEQNKLDYSKAEKTVENITLGESYFTAKWIKGQGYSIGLYNYKISKDYEELNDALELIGYRSTKDRDGDDILEKVGTTNWEQIIKCIKVIVGIEKMKDEEEAKAMIEETIKNINNG